MTKGFEFPITKIKVGGLTDTFNLSDPESRKKYFEAKVGDEIKKIKEFLQDNTFIAHLLGKKNSGKGTYTKLMIEIFGQDKIGHISVGDIVRAAHLDAEDEKKRSELEEYLKNNYRGHISVDEAIEALIGRDTKTLLPTELILALVKREVDKMPKKTLFVDGFPREMDQISYSLYFRDLINYREDSDVFVAIDIPESVIDARIKTRVICPKCKTPRSLKLFATKKVGHDKEKNEFYLICDNQECGDARMVPKEGDELGIEAIRERLEKDDKLITTIMNMHGIPKVYLRNSIPIDKAKESVDDYEITPEYYYELENNGQAVTKEKPWTIKDDQGVESYSLLAPPVAVSLIKQLVEALGL